MGILSWPDLRAHTFICPGGSRREECTEVYKQGGVKGIHSKKYHKNIVDTHVILVYANESLIKR